MMNFHSPFPVLFHMPCEHLILCPSTNVCSFVKKSISAKASAKAGGLWVEKYGSRNQKPGLWPVLKQWVDGLPPGVHDLACLHGLQAQWQYSFPHLLKFRNFFPNKFVVSSCFLRIRTVSPQNMASFGERNSRNTICKICT